MIDIAMTASLRPEILKQTLTSLKSKLITNRQLRLIVDIAPVGDTRYTQGDVLDVATSIMGKDNVLYRMLPESLQAEAVKWTWSEIKSEFSLQWEDDWLLMASVELIDLIDFMKGHPSAGKTYFDRAGKSVFEYAKYQDGQFERVDLNFFKRVKGCSIGGPPAIMRKDYVREVLPLLDGKTCLDLLSDNIRVRALLSKWETYLYVGEQCTGHLVKDIGKQWLSNFGMKREKRTDKGVLWVPDKKKPAEEKAIVKEQTKPMTKRQRRMARLKRRLSHGIHV